MGSWTDGGARRTENATAAIAGTRSPMRPLHRGSIGKKYTKRRKKEAKMTLGVDREEWGVYTPQEGRGPHKPTLCGDLVINL